MNISSKYDLGDIVKELGSTNSAKASKTAGSEGIFGAILSNLAAAGITGKVAAEVAEAVESGATTPLSSPVNDLLAHLKAMQGESSATARNSTLESNSVIAATGLLAELKELQDLRKGDFESDAGKVSQSRIERDAAAMGAQGLIAFLQARLESSRAAVQPDVVSKSQADLTRRTNEKQSNPFTSLLTNDALRITKLQDSRAVLLGPDTARKPKEGASNRIENEFASLLNQISKSSVSKNDDSPEYWNRETARLLAEMARGNGASEFIPDTPSSSAKHIEASNSALTNASAFSAQLASINPVAGNNAATASSSVHIENSQQAAATGIEAANSALTNASAFSAQLASINPVAGNNAATASSSVHIENSRQATATGIESPSINYAQAQRPARFDNIGLLGQTATESLEMSATNAQAIAQTKTEAGQANQQLLAQRGEQLAVSAAPVNVQLVEKAQQQWKALTRSIEAGAVASASKTKSEANTAALKQQFANVELNEISTKPSRVITPLQTNPLGTAFAPIVNQTRQARDASPLTQGFESEITLKELELGISQGLNAKANDAVIQRVSIANLPQGIASRINPHLARGLGSGPTKISISLFPENYGQVDVEFVYSEEAGLRVSMSSESAETTRLLQSNSGGLREALLGNSLADVSVDVNAHGQSKHEGSAANEHNKATAKQVATESAIEAEPLKAKASSDNSDGLDTYV